MSSSDKPVETEPKEPVAEEQTEKTPEATIEPNKISAKIRYTALLLNCLLAFGGYLVYDLCSALKDTITADFNLSDTQFSLLYLVYAWTNCAMVLFAGALLDRTSNRQCALIFTTVSCVGQATLSLGVHLHLFWLMIVGRVIFGLGLGSICVSQNCISNAYFRGADLATSFACTLTISRIGSVLNFFLSTYIYTWFGSSLKAVFWWGTSMTALSVLAALIFFFFDRSIEKKGLIVCAARKSRKIRWKDILHFPPLYWVLCIVCSCYYLCIFALMAVIVSYLTQRDEIPTSDSGLPDLTYFTTFGNTASSSGSHFDHKYSIISSLIYLIAIPCVPIFGRAVDYFGRRATFLLISVAVMIPFNAYLNFTHWTPIPALVVAGASYSMVASALWPSICMSVRDEVVGTANGIATSIQMIGIGASNLLVGYLRDKYSWSAVMYYFMAAATVGTIFSVIVIVLDRTKFGGKLDKHSPIREAREAEKKAAQANEKNSESEDAPLLINEQTK